jgi:D-alanine-D-alanine ligase
MSKRIYRIAVLIHKGLLPPDSKNGYSPEEISNWKVEYDIITALKKLGHKIYPVEMYGELNGLREIISTVKPHLAFNLLEEFTEYPLFDQQVMSYLELKKIPYTGCNPRGLAIAKDKALSKKILAFHNINIPSFHLFPLNKLPGDNEVFKFPLFVKSLKDEGSVGISQDSVVHSIEKLRDRVLFLHNNFKSDVIAEEYIEGREIYVGVIGNKRLKSFTPWELILKNKDTDSPIATSKLKWDENYQKKVGLVTKAASLDPATLRKFSSVSKKIYSSLKLSGYARIDYKLTKENKIYLIEANPNPFLAKDEDFAASAKYSGYDYEKLVARIVSLGLNFKPFET